MPSKQQLAYAVMPLQFRLHPSPPTPPPPSFSILASLSVFIFMWPPNNRQVPAKKTITDEVVRLPFAHF